MGRMWGGYPPCKVEMNTMVSPSFSPYFSSPSSSQSVSLISTRIPGRLHHAPIDPIHTIADIERDRDV